MVSRYENMLIKLYQHQNFETFIFSILKNWKFLHTEILSEEFHLNLWGNWKKKSKKKTDRSQLSKKNILSKTKTWKQLCFYLENHGKKHIWEISIKLYLMSLST